ncbi:ATP-binding protein [Candidatus Kaiserbacteria bacterium]|nr:ATP-binding protein [Candidatus Kaiserbacteria bacterium]
MTTTHTKKIDITPDRTLFPKIGQTGYTAAQALSELIDNSIDAINPALGKVTVNIKIDKSEGRIIVEDNGLGMTEEVAANSIKIGSSRKREGELGQFGIGLKASCMSLGSKFTLETSPLKTNEEYVLIFDEKDFIERGSWGDFEIQIKSGSDIDKSFTRITIEKLKIRFYSTFSETIKKHLSERFSPFITNGELDIRFNKENIHPENVDIFPDSKKSFAIKLSNGDVIQGWTGILKVGSIEKSGFNLYRNKRLIRVHEKLGYVYHPSKMSITGEIYMDVLPVTINKREFETENQYYIEFFEKFSEYLKPILAEVQQRHQEEKIRDLPRDMKETLKDNLLKALNHSDELKELAFPGAEQKRDEKGYLLPKEERQSPVNELAVIEKLPETEKFRDPKKTSEQKARFIIIAGQRFRFDYEWGSLEESVAKEAYLDKEKHTIIVILNQNYSMLKVLPKPDLFYHAIFLTEGIVEVFLRENKQPLEKTVSLRDSLIQKLADIMAEDVAEEVAAKESQVLTAQTYLLKQPTEDKLLNESEIQVLERRLESGLTYQEIANEMHISRQRVEQIFKAGLRKINSIREGKIYKKDDAKITKDITKEAEEKVAKQRAIENIITNTAALYKVDIDELMSHSRQARLILPRHTIMYLLRRELNVSFPKIGKIMGKDHTTIIYAFQKMENLIKKKA